MKWRLILLVVTFGCLFSSTGLAIGLVHEKVDIIIYQPGFEKTIVFNVRNFNYDVNVSLEGDFSTYATISDVRDLHSGEKQFKLSIKFPNTLDVEPGMHLISVRAAEVGDPQKTVGSLTSVQKNLRVQAYSQEKFIKASLVAPDANQFEIMTFTIDVESLTYKDIELLVGEITLYDETGENVIDSVQTPNEQLASGEKKSMRAKFNTSELKPGSYLAKAKVTFDEKSLDLSDEFNIGTLLIKIINYTTEFVSGEIGDFSVSIESIWNNPVQKVYADLRVDGQKVLQTPSVDLEPFQSDTVSTFWNASKAPGTYSGKLTLHYGDGQQTVKEEDIIVHPAKGESIDVWKAATIVLVALILVIGLLMYKKISNLQSTSKKKRKKKPKKKKSQIEEKEEVQEDETS